MLGPPEIWVRCLSWLGFFGLQCGKTFFCRGASVATAKGIVAVARKAGVSPASASRVLAEDVSFRASSETRQRIFAAARELGYVSDARASQLRSGVSTVIGVLTRDLGSLYGSHFFYRFSLGLASMRKEVLLGVHGDNIQLARQHLNTFRSYHTFAVMLIAYPSDPTDYITELLREVREGWEHQIFVTFGGPNLATPAINVDIRWMCEEFFRMARADGRQRVVLAARSTGCNCIYDYFKEAAAAHPDIESEILQENTNDPARVTAGVLAWHQKSRSRAPAAVLTTVDTDAIDMVREMMGRGIAVPRDVAVMGYGNVFPAHFSRPEISTFDVQGTVPAMAAKALELVSEMSDAKSPAHGEHMFRPPVIVRESFVPRPAG